MSILSGIVNPYSGTSLYLLRLWPVIALMKLDQTGWVVQRSASKSGVQAQSLCGCPWSSGPLFSRRGQLSPFQHRFDPGDRFDGPDENGMWYVIRTRDYIEHLMNAIAQIDIGMASRAEHDLCPICAPVIPGMGSPIFGATVGFCFRDDTDCFYTANEGHQVSAEQVPSQGDDIFGLVVLKWQNHMETSVGFTGF